MPANRARGLQVIDPFLSSVARRYRSRNYIADQLMPQIGVSKLSGQYPVFDRNYWFAQQTDNKGSDRAPSREVDYEWSTDTFLCEEYKLKTSITDLEVAQAESELRLRQAKTEYLTLQMDLAKEVRVAACLQASTSTGGQLDSTMTGARSANWNTISTDIEGDVLTASNAIYDQIGQVPNTLVIPYKVAQALAKNTAVRLLISYEIQGGNREGLIQLAPGVLPPVLWGLNVVVARGQTIATKEGSSGALTEIWGTAARVLYVDKNAEWGIPSVAYDLAHTRRTVTRWNEIDPDRELVRELERVDEKVVAPFAGYVITNTLA